jgi:hypothetical protein
MVKLGPKYVPPCRQMSIATQDVRFWWHITCPLPGERRRPTPLVYGNHLRNGNTTSCGCMKIEMFTDMATTHGMAQTLTYRIWAGMMQRCYNPNDTAYEMYGGRGRTAHKSWHKFEGFFADMGECPEGMTLDRYPKRDGNYEKGNCRWATPQQQVINTDRVDEAVGVRRKGRGFEARITRGQQLRLGIFDTEEEAIAVRRAVKEQLDAADGIIAAVTLRTVPAFVGPPPDRTMMPFAASTMTAAQLCPSRRTTQSTPDAGGLLVISNQGRFSRAWYVSVLGGWSRRTLAFIFPNSIWPNRVHAG